MKRSKLNLSHYRLCDMNLGKLYPVACMEVLPGDTFRQSTTALVRMATLATPVMHPVSVRVHHFFVPNRIVWDDWENFITGKVETTIPTVAGSVQGDLMDYLGCAPSAYALNALPVRAYNKIWNEFFRDQDLHTPRTEDDVTIANISWQKDYFTTARAEAQQGEGVSIGFEADIVPIKGLGITGSLPNVDANVAVRETDTTGTRTFPFSTETSSNQVIMEVSSSNVASARPMVYADLSGSGAAIDVQAIRNAFAMQRFAEARNRYGSRYTDYLRYLGVRPSDSRLDRPEYLGGGQQTVSFSEVLATAESETTKVGDYTGHGIAAVRSRPYRRFFEEHGHVISLMSVRPKTIYMNQTPRNFFRSIKEDFWQKEYEIAGDQAVPAREVYNSAAIPDQPFGYVQRFREYREHVSGVAGEFRAVLADWHFGRQFQTEPALNGTFVTCDPDLRPFASQNDSQMYAMIAHKVAARRLVSKKARI